MSPPYDVVILGAGTAGLAAWRAASATTDRVLLVEADRYGTTCARVGCMPSKLLIAAADAAHQAREAAGFGVQTTVAIDDVAVLDRVRAERDRFVTFPTASAEAIPENQRRMGRARFLSDTTLAVGDDVIETRTTVIATGSRPTLPPVLRGLGDRVVFNDQVFDWRRLPRKVALFGLGVIGLELGQALARLGVEVRGFGISGTVGPLTDPVIKATALASLSRDFPMQTEAQVTAVVPEGSGVRVMWREGDAHCEEAFDVVLAATGRAPNLDGLGLERTSLTLDRRGVPAHDLQTTLCEGAPIFLAGDAAADRPLLHEAADEGRIAGLNAARWPNVAPEARRSPLAVVFTDPQMLMVGQTWASLQGQDVITGAVSFEDQGRSRVMRQNQGRLHLYVARATGRLLGAEGCGPRAEHLGHQIAWVHQLGLTVPQILDLPFYHPVVEEGLRTALRDANGQL